MESAILKTLAYADIFNFPLKSQEIWRRLIWEKGNLPLKKDFQRSLKRLVARRKVFSRQGFYFLEGKWRTVDLRKEREQESIKKIKKALKIGNLLKIFPTIKMVALTGGVAAGNASKNDDIDFLIVTSSGWLWTTRLFATLFLSLLGVRRKVGEKNFADKICLNIFVDESNLSVFAKDRNVFVANELALLKPLWQRGQTYQKMIRENSWVGDFLPNMFPSQKLDTGCQLTGPIGPVTRFTIGIIEKVFYYFQLWWMRKRRTVEVVTPHFAAFHPKSVKNRVLKEFKKKIAILGIE